MRADSLLRRSFRIYQMPFLVALVIATTALTTVSLLDGFLQAHLSQEVAQTFGANLELTRSEPFPHPFLAKIRTPGVTETHLVRFPTVVVSGTKIHLVQLNAVGLHYPLLGRVHIARGLDHTSETLARGPRPGAVWVTPELLSALATRVGARLEIGYQAFTISGLLLRAPAVTTGFALFTPPVLISRESLAATRLVGTQSRIEYALLARGPPAAIHTFRTRVKHLDHGLGIDVGTPRKEAGRIQAAVKRTQRYLALAISGTLFLAFFTLLLSARDAARTERTEVALLRTFGMRRSTLFGRLLLERALQVGAGTLLGGALGWGCYLLFLNHMGIALHPAGGGGSLFPTLVTTLLATAFLSYASALPAWLWLLRISPAEALRDGPQWQGWEAGPTAASALVLILAYGIWYATGGAGNLLYLTLSLVLILTVSTLAFLALRFFRRTLTGRHAELGWVISSLNRRPAFVALALGSLTLIIFVLVFLGTARTSLFAGYRRMFGPTTPNWFVIGIEPGERARLLKTLEHHQIKTWPFAPLYVARLVALDGHRLHAHATDNRARRFWIRHDQSLSASARLPAGDRIVAGRFWRPGTHQPDASLVRGFARMLGVHLGDRLEYRIAGTRFTVRVTSFRTVHWDHMTPNFFVLLAPSAVRGLPHSYLTSLRAPHTARAFLARLPSRFPGVTVIDIHLLIRELRHLLTQAAQAVSVLMLTTLAASLLLAYLVVALTREERTREIILFRTLGVRMKRILVWLAIEYGLLGLASGILGDLAASTIGWFEARKLLAIRYHLDWPIILATPWIAAACTLALGFLAMAPALSASRKHFWRTLNSG